MKNATKVHHGYCPEKKNVSVSSKSCSWDANCASDEKCCPSERRKRCTKALPEKPGLCPMKCFARVFSRCKNECKDDRSCPEEKKCCFADCGLKCVPPVNGHSGRRTPVGGNCGEYCLLHPERGNCHREVTRFFYDSVARKCKKFTYGGCGGNENNFLTSTECLRVCEGVGVIAHPEESEETEEEPSHDRICQILTVAFSFLLPEVCLLPSDRGDCDAHIPRFFHNSASGECEKFIYGGCGGNENNFLSKEECLQVCSGKGEGQERTKGGVSFDREGDGSKNLHRREIDIQPAFTSQVEMVTWS
ncbi:hypothetical protein JD844_019407 [Phrynosoma platyrhinos]|uniref:Uncharacterized protein n=1 Tax=Phrynosoma platyrhinos TaxID=52577 RepID=A0ABQ7SPR9_PHRPL|nr:hypothetical protein JD844_019407 [Phrynosoma platyrhinos]